MARPGSLLASFASDLRRRQVLRVLGIYTVVAWLILQLAADTFPPLNVPDWVHAALIVALVLGFPVAAVLAWVFDITPEGIVRTEPSEPARRLNEFGEAVAEHPRLWIDVLIIVALLGIVAFLLLRPGQPEPERDTPSIAVLPFADMSERQDSAFFSDGITESVLDRLVRIPGAQVVARTSTFAYKQRPQDVRDIGARLGADTILEGSVRRVGEAVRITAQLIDVETGYHLWSATYNRTLDDIFAVQDEIAGSIARALQIRLTPESSEPDSTATTADMEAYDLYLHGRGALRDALTERNIERAIDYFHEALRIDPRFVLADAGLCFAYWEMYELTRSEDYIDRALEACNTARVRTDGVPDVHAALGWVLVRTGKPRLALEEFHHALEIDSDNAEALRGAGWVNGELGDVDAAEALLRDVVRLEPDYWRSYASLGAFFHTQGRFEEAARVFRQGSERIADHPHLLSNLAATYVQLGRREEAASAYRALLVNQSHPRSYASAGTNYFYMGRFSDALGMYAKAVSLSPDTYEFHHFLADTCRQLPDGSLCESHHTRRAIQLAAERLNVNPRNLRAAADLAVLHARQGNTEAARNLATYIHERETQDVTVLRKLAIMELLEGDPDRTFELLAEALAGGLPVHELNHPDFHAVRDDPRFEGLLAGDREKEPTEG